MAREMDFVDECYADKNLSLLKKLTLVIPTYNRNYYLSRCLWYHAHFPFGQIIVADSSPEEKKVVNRETVAKVREIFGADILYLEYEPDTDKYGGEIYLKWGDAIQHIGTEYSLICTDKEFVIPNDTIRGIDYLSKHPKYCTAMGQGAFVTKEKIFNRFIAIVDAKPYAYTQDAGIDRIDACAIDKKMLGSLLTLYRSEDHKKIYTTLRLHNLDDLRYGETALELIPLMQGKIRRWAEIGKVRDTSMLQKGVFGSKQLNESSTARYPQLTLYPKKRNETYFNKLIACIVELENNSATISSAKLSKSLSEIFTWWMGGSNHHTQTINERNKLFGIIWYHLPYELKYYLSHMFGNGLVVSNKILSHTKDEVNLILKIIRETIHSYHDDKIISFLSNDMDKNI